MSSGEGRAEASSRGGPLAAFLIRGGLVTMVARIGAVGAGFATQIVLARLLDPAQLGAFFLVQSVALAAADLAQLGLPRVISRELARSRVGHRVAPAAAFLGRALLVGLVSIAITGLLYALFIGDMLAIRVFGSSHMQGTAAVTALWLVGLAVQGLISESLRGTHAVSAASILGGSLASFVTCLVLSSMLFADVNASLLQVVLVPAIGTLSSGAISGVLLRRRVGSRGSASPPALSHLLSSASSMLALGVGTTLVAQSDLWLLGVMLEEGEVALYGAARRLIMLVALPLTIVGMVVPPLIADLYDKGEHALLERMLRGTASIAGLPSILLLIAFAVLGKPLLGVAFGEYYQNASTVLVILSVERMIFVLGGSCGMLLMMTRNDRRMLRVIVSVGFLQVVSVYVGTLLSGIEGAAAGFLLASLVRTVLLWNAARRATGIRTDVSLRHAHAGMEIILDRLGIRAGSQRDR